ncbi:MAG: hypothetical protein ACLQVJ_28275 [Syntrophobacteraceae bacterium]
MGPKRKTPDEDARAEAEERDEGRPLKEDVSEYQVRKGLKESPLAEDERVRENEATEGEVYDTPPENANPIRKPRRFKKAFLLGSAALCLFLAAGGFLLFKFKAHIGLFGNSVQRLEPVTSIMRPIPMPNYREMLDFLLVYEVEGQKMITAIRMEVGYLGPTRYQNFKEQNVAFRDTVYSFLLKQNIPGNSVKSWHSVLESDLADCLRVKLPQSYPDKILLTQVENL